MTGRTETGTGAAAPTGLRRGTLALPMAPIGPVNPLPPLAGLLDPPYALDMREAPARVRRGAEYGHVATVLPYLLQDGYGRRAHPTTLHTVELGNDRLRAVFLPGLGGRLWSLTDLRNGRELLHQPEVLQPANLGLRGAWFAGGVEWNIGTRGHCPLTCDPLHTAVVTRRDGTEVLRMWEYERMRGVVFQVEAWLPPGSAVLYVGVAVRNPQTGTVPLYWWSNSAVPQTDELVVRAPATTAFRTGYAGRLERVEARDVRPGRVDAAADYFYDINPGVEQPWIEAGLVQRSTALLRGRKLFCWGETIGGHRWQEWLGGGRYCEIQAGLATTQYEHVPLPAGERWSWVESYGPACPPAGALDAELTAFRDALDVPAAEVWCTGSGWGALEEVRRRVAGEPPLATPGTPFPASVLGPEQEPWAELVTAGVLPAADPVSYVAGPQWRTLLAKAPRNWATDYHLGVLAHVEDPAAAAAHYQGSLHQHPTPWAQRALGLLMDDADLVVAAHRALPQLWQLAVEAMAALQRAGRPAEALGLVDALPAAVREHGRIRLGEATAALATGDTGRAAALLHAGIEVADLREGEVSLDALWERACPGEPLPERYDFRMKPVEPIQPR